MGLLGYFSAIGLQVPFKRDEKGGLAVIYMALSTPASLYDYAK